MPRYLPKSTWDRVRQLFVGGMSVSQISAKTGIPKGSIAARSAREKWIDERNGIEKAQNQIATETERFAAIQSIVTEHRFATLLAEAETARRLAEEALRKVKEHVPPVESLDDLEKIQNYRSGIWPSAWVPEGQQQPGGQINIVLSFDHERPQGDSGPTLILPRQDQGS